MHAGRAIDLKRANADQRAQLASRLPPLQIHLEKAILGVQKTKSARGITARRGRDCRHAQMVMIHRGSGLEPSDGDRASEERQAGVAAADRHRR